MTFIQPTITHKDTSTQWVEPSFLKETFTRIHRGSGLSIHSINLLKLPLMERIHSRSLKAAWTRRRVPAELSESCFEQHGTRRDVPYGLSLYAAARGNVYITPLI